MFGRGTHRWYFVGKPPWSLWVVVVLLFVNTFANVFLFPLYEHFAHRRISSQLAAWIEAHGFEIQFILLGIGALLFVIYRKSVRYEYLGAKRK